jgi:hypothetical protein
MFLVAKQRQIVQPKIPPFGLANGLPEAGLFRSYLRPHRSSLSPGLGNCNWNEMVPESRDLVCYFHTRILPGNVHKINCNGWKARVLLQHIRNLLTGLEKSHSKKGRHRLLVNGLFGIHMPILYGEGSTAFLRLQTEILKLSDDESIFAWSSED